MARLSLFLKYGYFFSLLLEEIADPKTRAMLISQGRNRTLEEWLKSLPRQILEDNSWLLYWMGAALIIFDPRVGESCFERAFEGFREDKNETGLFMAWWALFLPSSQAWMITNAWTDGFLLSKN